jgi:hypothetical protein
MNRRWAFAALGTALLIGVITDSVPSVLVAIGIGVAIGLVAWAAVSLLPRHPRSKD